MKINVLRDFNRKIRGYRFTKFKKFRKSKQPPILTFQKFKTFRKLLLPPISFLFLTMSYAQDTKRSLVLLPPFTELTTLDNTIKIDLRYATTNNFMKAKIYDCGRCYLRPEAAKAIAKAHKLLKDKGYGGLKIFDAYRPKPYQQRLWDKMPNASYVTPPWKGSQHSRGLAVDLTVIDKNGKELEMGTPYDTFSPKAHSDCTDLPKNVLENRKLLRGVMAQVGFKGIRTEWWHFAYQNKKYDLSDWVWQCK